MLKYALIGDIGGTNTRLALFNLATGKILRIKVYLSQYYSSLEDIIRVYLKEEDIFVQNICISIAGPVVDDTVSMTNHSWTFSINEMKKKLGLIRLEVINDFSAISMAIPILEKKHLIQIGGLHPIKGKPIVVYGAGTGLGVACLIYIDNRWISLPGEGGHIDFAPNNKEEDMILSVLRSDIGHVSVERILSGPGLVNLYRAIVKSENRIPNILKPKDVIDRAIKNTCADCYRALSLFCIIMGRFGGNLALTMGAFCGVYIAGGIVSRFLDFFKSSDFRRGFEDKGRFQSYVKNIPVYLIKHKNPGLLGSGAYLRQILERHLT